MNESFINEKQCLWRKLSDCVNAKSRTICLMSFFLLLSTFIPVLAQDAKVSLNKQNVPLSAILDEIETKTNYLFVVNSKVNTKREVSVKVKQEPVKNVLEHLFKGMDVAFSQEGSHIIIGSKDNTRVTKRTLTGVVKDENGETLINANVMIKGTTIGTVTDFDGKFSLTGDFLNGDVLVFRSLGMKPQEMTIGTKNNFLIVMTEDTKLLNEVVVTAMGIEKKASSLTYATQQVAGKELTRAKDANFINSLQGKASGLVITPNASGAGGSSKLLLRGNSSILGNNSPLIVLDGVPMADRTGNQIGDALLSGGTGKDGGDGLSNINPDDIASITVLKGANAAALYGSSAANGVLIITTKQGTEGRVNIDVSSSSMFEKPLIVPQFQNYYGAKVGNYSDVSINPNNPVQKRRLEQSSWGLPMGALSQNTLAEIPYARNNGNDNIGNFLETGTNFNNSIAISSGSKVSSTYFSYGYTTANGMIPANAFYRHNATFRQTVKAYNDRLQFNFSGSYIKQRTYNRPGSGFYANPLYTLYLMPRNADIRYFENNSEVMGNLYYNKAINDVYRSHEVIGPIQQWPWIGDENQNSPYWYTNRLKTMQTRERIFAMIGVKAEIIKDLTANVRLKIDNTTDTNEEKTYKGTKAKEAYNSIYSYGNASNRQLFADFLVSYVKKISDFDISANLGGSTQKDDVSTLGFNYWMGDSTAIPNKFSPTNIITSVNGTNIGSYKGKNQNWSNALYGTISVGYKELAYVDATVRTDWSRAFTQFELFGTPDHYTYYSVGGNALLEKIFRMNPEIINNMKLRLSYSEVGNSIPNIDMTALGENIGNLSASGSAYRNFANPVPEMLRSTELGLDGSLFNRKIDFDVTFYNTMMLHQWLPKKAATGAMLPLNSGRIRNRGLETTLSYTLSPNPNIFWKTTVNYSYNVNKILETYGPNGDNVMAVEPVFQGGLRIKYEVGKPYGELYGKTFMYDDKGNIRLDRKGAPRITTDYNHYLGNANSPHHLSWGNMFNYKNFNIYALIDGKIGGKVISYTEARMDMYGVSKRTGDVRNSGVIYLKKEIIGSDIVGTPVAGVVMPDGNIAPAMEYYRAIGGGEPCLSEYVYDATNFRLREVSVGYTFRNIFGNGKDFSVSVVGRNLCFLYKDSPVDPDVSVSTANSYGGIEAFSLPTARSFGLNLKASF